MFDRRVFPAVLCAIGWASLCRPVWAHHVGKGQHLPEVFRFARCRASCLDKLGLKTDNDDIECTGDKECNMCWDVCKFFNKDFEVWKHMCTVEELCFPGCQVACSFWHKASQKPPGSAVTSHSEYRAVFSEPPRLEAHGAHDVRVTWSRPLGAQDDLIERGLVYVLFLRGLVDDQRWEDAGQTQYHNATLSRSQLKDSSELEIIALSAYGVFAHTRVSLDLESAAFDSMQADASASSGLRCSESGGAEALQRTPGRSRHRLGHQSVAGGQGSQVMWKVLDTAVDVTGRLYTSRPSATLPLWGGTSYSIFVRRLSPVTGEPDAETLSRFLDTPVVEPEPSTEESASTASCVRIEMVAACAVFSMGAIFVCVVVLALVAVRKSIRPGGEAAATKSTSTKKCGSERRSSRRSSQLCSGAKALLGAHSGSSPASPVGESCEDLLAEAQLEGGGTKQCFVYDNQLA
ncbi:uncharacterized protein [Dermacentor albipictus]|uniref:uncharacterized protein n=1 Tax=Dermacentor albipictus TaxID=60249 RepID=UPI0038FC9E25